MSCKNVSRNPIKLSCSSYSGTEDDSCEDNEDIEPKVTDTAIDKKEPNVIFIGVVLFLSSAAMFLHFRCKNKILRNKEFRWGDEKNMPENLWPDNLTDAVAFIHHAISCVVPKVLETVIKYWYPSAAILAGHLGNGLLIILLPKRGVIASTKFLWIMTLLPNVILLMLYDPGMNSNRTGAHRICSAGSLVFICCVILFPQVVMLMLAKTEAKISHNAQLKTQFVKHFEEVLEHFAMFFSWAIPLYGIVLPLADKNAVFRFLLGVLADSIIHSWIYFLIRMMLLSETLQMHSRCSVMPMTAQIINRFFTLKLVPNSIQETVFYTLQIICDNLYSFSMKLHTFTIGKFPKGLRVTMHVPGVFKLDSAATPSSLLRIISYTATAGIALILDLVAIAVIPTSAFWAFVLILLACSFKYSLLTSQSLLLDVCNTFMSTGRMTQLVTAVFIGIGVVICPTNGYYFLLMLTPYMDRKPYL